jgi:hypothetical protein
MGWEIDPIPGYDFVLGFDAFGGQGFLPHFHHHAGRGGLPEGVRNLDHGGGGFDFHADQNLTAHGVDFISEYHVATPSS